MQLSKLNKNDMKAYTLEYVMQRSIFFKMGVEQKNIFYFDYKSLIVHSNRGDGPQLNT